MCGRTACSLSKRSLQKATSYVPKRDCKSDVIVLVEDQDSQEGNPSEEKDEVLVEPQWLSIHETLDYAPSYNQCPGSCLPILVSSAHHDPNASDCSGRSIIPMGWGLIPGWFKCDKKDFKLKTHNARSERIGDGSSMYKACLDKGKRGLLLVEGYFEWTRDGQPHFFYHPQSNNINFKTRNNWSELNFVNDGKWKGPKIMTLPVIFDINRHCVKGSPYYSFSIITTEAHDEIQWIHDRMPVILDNDSDREKWLDYKKVGLDEALKMVKEPYSGSLDYHVVPDEMGSVRYTSINCVLAIDPLKKKKSNQPTIDTFFKRVNTGGEASGESKPAKVMKLKNENEW